MKKFNYPYEKILILKSFIKREKEIAFSEIAFKINKLKNQIKQRQNYLLNQKKDDKSKKKFRNIKLDIYNRLYNDRLAKEIKLLEKEIESLMEEYNKRKEEYIKARQEEQIYEKLKEKMLIKYKSEFYKEEGKILDEIGTNNFLKENI